MKNEKKLLVRTGWLDVYVYTTRISAWRSRGRGSRLRSPAPGPCSAPVGRPSGLPRVSVRASGSGRRCNCCFRCSSPKNRLAVEAGAAVILSRPDHPRARSRTSTLGFQGGHLLQHHQRVYRSIHWPFAGREIETGRGRGRIGIGSNFSSNQSLINSGQKLCCNQTEISIF